MGLSPELEQEVVEQELRRDNAACARRILERALEVQLRTLALGLTADRLLTGRPVTDFDWWTQYLTQRRDAGRFHLDVQDQGFVKFRDGTIAEIVAGRLARVKRRSLRDVKIRILGGWAHIWEDRRVNSLLRALGSSMRLLTVGSSVSGPATELHDLLGLEGSPPPMDARFIFGRISPMSVSIVGSECFQFELELACSPDCSASPGFADDRRIVVRETILRMEIESKGAEGEYSDALAERAMRVRAHESGHVIDGYHTTFGLLSSSQFWPNFVEPRYWPLLRDDICRFACSPRSLDELTEFFRKLFWYFMSRDIQNDQLRGSVSNVINRLESERRLERLENGRVHCPLYDEKHPWTLPS